MHGRPRKAPKPEAEAEAASAIKAEKLRILQSTFLQNHLNKIYTKEALDVSAKLLESNPEVYTGWNYRKLAVEHQLSQSESDPEAAKNIFDEELRVVESALRTNFKSYGAWHHRKWVLSKGQSPLDHELRLLDKFQKADSRNFHAWNYRRFVAELMKTSAEKELQYTTNMIETNFSNYSAWHNRSAILSHLLKKKASGFESQEKVLTEEFELVHQAIFTDPDDQSGWFYHLWLLQQTVKPESPFLISSWPPHASDLMVASDSSPSSSASSTASYVSKTRTLPLILYFDQLVKGVNSSTITVDSELCSSTNLIWRPVSKNTATAAQAWITELTLLDAMSGASKAYPIKISIGHSEGVTSLSNVQLLATSQIAFTVNIEKRASDNANEQDVEEILWTDGNFHASEIHHKESVPVHPFTLLSIADEKKPPSSTWHVNTLLNEITLFRELLSEISCKIGKLTLARLLTAYDSIMMWKTNPPCAYKFVHTEEVLELYSDLMKSDPSHFQYYKDQHSSAVLQKETASNDSLSKHSFFYKNSASASKVTCLRLNSMSLSRIGFIERLLWVQMLDLSHNEIRTIDGLEALQLLRYLNLSDNKIKSFTALEPLRQLPLEVLNISRNEIGSHSIDTTRYLSASPLSHTYSNPDFITSDPDDIKNYWEAYILFKGLSLTQLDIAGNQICDDKFISFLVKVLTSLQWLNGRKL
uniref:Geranylgeranyl transferase type-2 subunit alpha n=1 Tax=Kalanchoe fedtschenkoi TaxID=63787 RepID=A0A7N0V0N3_KALFE